MYKVLSILFLLLILITGCLGDSPASRYVQFIELPANASDIQSHYFGRGQARVFHLKFLLEPQHLSELLDKTCFDELTLQSNPFSRRVIFQDALPEWWNPEVEDEVLFQSCSTSRVVYSLVSREADNRLIIYIRMSLI